METRRLFSKWWFIALISLTVGGLVYIALPMALKYPSSSMMWLFSLVYCAWGMVLTCALMTSAPWRPLDIDGRLDPIALRHAGYEVAVRGSDFDLRVEKYSIARIRVRDGATSYRSLPTSTGFWVVFLLCISSYLTILAFLFLLHIYVQGQKGMETKIPKLEALSRPSEKDVDEMIMDSLTGMYMLARQTAETRRSSYHDHVIILVVMSLIGFAALLVMNEQYPINADEYVWRLGGGIASLIAITIAGTMMLWRRARRTVERDERWADRLMAFMRDAASDEGSAAELLLRACSEVPRWLSAHRRGIWHRRPAMTLLIALLLNYGVFFLCFGYGFDMAYMLGGICLTLGTVLMLDQYHRGRKESAELAEDWNKKMAELESVLGLRREQ